MTPRIFPGRFPLSSGMDSFLPPATPEQIAAVYNHLHVTHRAVLLTQWHIFFSLLGVTLNLFIPWLLLAMDLSASLRDRASSGAVWLLRLGYVARLMRCLDEWEKRQMRNPRLARLAEWDGRMDRWARGLRAWREWDPAFFRTVVLYGAAYSVLYRLIKLPINLSAYHIEAAYGLTHLSPSAWISVRSTDWLVGFAVNTLGTVLVLWLIRFSPRRWPVVLAALFVGLALAFWWLPQPPDPDLRPLPGGALSQRLHALAARAGMPQVQMLVDETAEGRDESNGFAGHSGRTPRILLTRRMLDTEPPEQVEATLAHEIGHCVHQDDVQTLLPTALGVFFAFPFIRWLAQRLLVRFGPLWRVSSLADPAALPVLLIAFHLVTLMTDPLANAYSRALEHQADAYGLALTRNRIAAAEETVRFCNEDGGAPAPPSWFVFWHDNHPTDMERLRFALTGQPGRVRCARSAGSPRRRPARLRRSAPGGTLSAGCSGCR